MWRGFNFFDQKKDLILKITNAILIIWIIIASTFFYVNISNIVYKEKVESFETYKTRYCSYYEKEEIEEDRCDIDYQNHVIYFDETQYNNKKQLFIAFGNILIIKIVLLLLNRKKVIK